MKIKVYLLFALSFSFTTIFGQSEKIATSRIVERGGNGIKVESPQSTEVNNNFEIQFSETGFQISDNGKLLKSYSNDSQKIYQFEVLGGGGDDVLSIDLNNVNVPFNIKFDGQNNLEGTIGDVLEIKNGNSENAVYHYYNESDGLIELDGSKIEYYGLEPINGGDAMNSTFNLPSIANPDAAFGANAAPGNLEITGSTFENTVIPFPTNSLTINLGNGDDNIIMNDPGTLSTAVTITIDGAGGTDVLTVDALGGTYSDDGSVIQLTGSYAYNYSNFETVTVINGTLLPSVVPTVSEWGLIILALLVLTLGVLFNLQTSLQMEGNGFHNISLSQYANFQLPFDIILFQKTWIGVISTMILLFTFSIFFFAYELTNADVPMGILASGILAYLVHLLILEERMKM